MQGPAVQTVSPKSLSSGDLQLSCADPDHLPVPQQLYLRTAETPSAVVIAPDHTAPWILILLFICKQDFFRSSVSFTKPLYYMAIPYVLRII